MVDGGLVVRGLAVGGLAVGGLAVGGLAVRGFAVDLDLVDLYDCFISSVIVSSNSSGIWTIGLDLHSLYDLTVIGV